MLGLAMQVVLLLECGFIYNWYVGFICAYFLNLFYTYINEYST